MKSMSRKQQILQALAEMLEEGAGHKITTARLAERVGVSEAALYRHFPSKARMFEGLIEFIEETIFTRINRILDEEERALARTQAVLYLLLAFAERNPGMCRILAGDALAGEVDRLRDRVAQFFERVDLQLKHIIRESGLLEDMTTPMEPAVASNLLLAVVEGRIAQFVRSHFNRKPTDHWDDQWEVLASGIFGVAPVAQTETG
ncbi:nucleoid occlusion factor SlmA [Natronospirillum operosum]|uniref:Nucleoid occlusion factor SlmA n=1 Tax=Natronospirillum operosum TaxID=2759953 RepID=A0A4Z0WD17_9GAMM|nr:nucleoid occlusion factor SlmA [Natronospirillum operosum]TGG91674.1 nucleoid occlusion factor SlmA [Natronospirillum operosum]